MANLRKVPAEYTESSSLTEAAALQREQVLQDEVDHNAAIIAEREEGVKELEQKVEDLHEVFVDFKELVDKQGESVQIIANNIEKAGAHVKAGVAEISEAEKYTKRSRSKLCIALAIVAGIVVCVAVIVVAAVFA